MRHRMSMHARRELIWSQAKRYRGASRREKSGILDEFGEATGFNRKYAVGVLLRPPVETGSPRRRVRVSRYASDVPVIERVWEVSGHLCSKRLVAERRARRRHIEYRPHDIRFTRCCGQCNRLVAYLNDGFCRRCNAARRKAHEPQSQWKEDGTWEWRQSLNRAWAAFLQKQASRQRCQDPWARRFRSALSGMRNRRWRQATHKPRKVSTIGRTWHTALFQELLKAKLRSNQRQRTLDPWRKTMETKAHNWRQKAAARRRMSVSMTCSNCLSGRTFDAPSAVVR